MPTTKFTTLANLDRYTTHVEEKNVQVTRDEYINLPSSKLTDNRSYFIKDEGVVIKNGVEYGGSSAGDTTYSLSVGIGEDINKIVLTPSTGNPDKIIVPYATSAGNANTVSNHTVAKDVPADAKFTDTTYDNATTTTAGLMSAGDKVKVDNLGTASTKDVPSTGNASSTQVVMGNDTRLTDARTPVSHTHTKSEITDFPTSLPASDTTDTYSSTGTAPVSGKAVAAALGTLDVTGATGIGAGKTISAWSETDGKVSITTQNISITKSQVSDFPALGTAAAKDVPATGNASTSQVVMGNDTRLSDARNAADVYSWAKASTKPTYSYSEITNTPTIPTITDTYSGTSSDGMSGKAVKSAIDALDGTITGSAGAGKTLTALSQTDGKVSATFGNISITKSQVSDFPSLGNAAAKNYTTSVTNGSSDLITSGAVWTAIDNLPEPMVFKGSLGTGGTITALPVDGSAAIGDTYKVITAGTYASKAAKVGDTFICLTKTSSANTWELIPSGDEPSGTVTSVGVSNGGGLSVSGSPVTTSGTITISHADTSSQASVNNSGRTYIQDITLDTYGHVTGIASATETVTNTDRYVNSASFAHDSTNDNVKMTLTRAGSDTATVTGNIPKVSSSSAGVAPKGAAVSTQSQSTKFLREDGTWAAPSYTTNTNTTYTFANGTNGFTVTPSGGSAQTVTVTPSITNNVTGSGTNGYIAKQNGTNTVTNGPAFGSTTTTYLNNAGSWATPPDTKNTAGSTDTSSKIFLIGATSQAANPQTYSDNEVYATNGVLTTKSVQVGGTAATIQYNSTNKCIDFVFA